VEDGRLAAAGTKLGEQGFAKVQSGWFEAQKYREDAQVGLLSDSLSIEDQDAPETKKMRI